MDIIFNNNGVKLFLENLKNNNMNKYQNKYINIHELERIIEESKKQNIKLIYKYDIISYLYDFKINNKSISCFDILENKIYFQKNSNRRFALICFDILNK